MRRVGAVRKAKRSAAPKPTGSEVERMFSRLAETFSGVPNVTLGGGKGFGSGALKVNGKIFAMLSSNRQFVVKLSKKRVDKLIASGVGERFEPRPGKPMKEWLVVRVRGAAWAKLAKEASEFVAGQESIIEGER